MIRFDPRMGVPKHPLTRANVRTQRIGFDIGSTVRVLPIILSDGTAALGITYFPHLDMNNPSSAGATDKLMVVENQDLKPDEFDVLIRFQDVRDLGPYRWSLDQIEDILTPTTPEVAPNV